MKSMVPTVLLGFQNFRTVFPFLSSVQCPQVLPVPAVISSVLFSPVPQDLLCLDFVSLHPNYCGVIRRVFSGHSARHLQRNPCVITSLLRNEISQQLCTVFREKFLNIYHLSSKTFHFRGCTPFGELLLPAKVATGSAHLSTSSCLLVILSSPAHLHAGRSPCLLRSCVLRDTTQTSRHLSWSDLHVLWPLVVIVFPCFSYSLSPDNASVWGTGVLNLVLLLHSFNSTYIG